MRVALVVQRYGLEVLGGSETLARRIAELLAPHVDVTVLTTCALDYGTWADHYESGEDEVNGVRLLRFSVPRPRDSVEFDEAGNRAFADPENVELGRAWMRAQGPHSPGLLAHLRDEGEGYDAIAFMTYLYATTAEGLPLVAERSLLCPTMHDEPPLMLGIFDEVFASARVLLFNTPEERELARERFGVEDERSRIVGIGIDEVEGDSARFASETGIGRPYALYHGRLDPSKGVLELVGHHRGYRAAHPDGLDLVLAGEGQVAIPELDGFHAVGYLREELKHDAIAGATVVVCPSPYESLSFSQLEAWLHGRPTLANAASPVLVGQSRRAGGGLWYESGDEYTTMLDFFAQAAPLANAIGAQGRRYMLANYRWDRVREAWLSAISEVARDRLG